MKITVNTPPPIQPPRSYVIECGEVEAGYLHCVIATCYTGLAPEPVKAWAGRLLAGLNDGEFPTYSMVAEKPEPR